MIEWFVFLFYFLGGTIPRGMQDLSSLTRDEPVPPAVEAQSPNQWTAREFPLFYFFNAVYITLIRENT